MRHYFLLKYLVLTLISLFFIGCANIQPPTGGVKDTINPKVNYSESDPSSYPITNYSGHPIELSFTEYIQARNINKELLISPNIDIDYDYIINNNELTLLFKDTLPDNTTFIIHFRNGIQDITENNPVENLELALSTGPFIDSLTISGSVMNAFTGQPSANTLVALYPAHDTLTITEDEPWYYTETDQNGLYSFEHLPPGNFELYALKDKNNNLIYDPLSEEIAFLEDTIQLSVNQRINPLRLFQTDTLSPRLIGKETYTNVANLKFTKSIDSIYLPDYQYIKYKKVNSTKTEYTLYLNDRDTSEIYIPFTYYDSLGRGVNDTVFLSGKEKKYVTSTTYNLESRMWRSSDDTIRVAFDEPIIFLDSSAFQTGKDSSRAILVDTKLPSRELKFILPLGLKDSVSLIIPDSAIKVFGGLFIEADTLILTMDRPENYGVLKGKILTENKSYILQLINDKKQLIREVENPEEFQFSFLKPGTYMFRVLIDSNNNGVYEYGNYFARRQPEPVYIHPRKYPLKANWEIRDIELKF